jgi:hypothetical protein
LSLLLRTLRVIARALGVLVSAGALAAMAQPVVTTSGGTTQFLQGIYGASTPVVVDFGLTVIDASSPQGGVISISANFASGDILSANTAGTVITASYDTGTGALTLSGSDTVAHYQQVLRSISYTTNVIAPSTATRTVSFTVTDAVGTSTPATKLVSVTASMPVVTPSPGTTAFVQGIYGASTPVAIDSGLAVTDPGSTTLPDAVVSIAANFAPGDTLSFTDQNGITGSYNSGTGVLSLSGTASVANYQTALRSITYTTSALSPSTATRTVSFTVNDGVNSSAAASKSVSVAASAPTVFTSTGTTAFVAATSGPSAPVVIDAALTIVDTGSISLDSAAVAVSLNFAAGDTLLFTNQNGITGSYNSGTGVLSLSGTASLAFYQMALRSVTYTSTLASPSTATRTVSFTVTDAVHTSAAAAKLVSVTANQAPVVTTSPGSATFITGSSAVAVDPGVTVTDADSATLPGATVSITGNFHAGEDVLAFTNTSAATFGNVTGSYNAATGVLTLTSAGSTATVGQWQSVLQAVTYDDTSGTPNTTPRTIAFVASDGVDASNAASRTVAILLGQSIAFANPGSQGFGTTPTLAASANSGLAVTFSSSTPSVCTITTAGVLTTVSVGSPCTILVNQGGNGVYAPAPQASQSFAIAAVVPGAPTIGTATAGDTQATVAFSAPAFTGGASITGYTATSSPGGVTGSCASSPCIVTGLVNGTAYTFTAKATNSAGTGAASAASNSVTPKAAQSIAFTNPGSVPFGTSPTLAATASSGLAVTFTSGTPLVCTITTGGLLTTVSVGSCTIHVDQPGNGAFLAAPQASQSFAIAAAVPGAPTIGSATAGDAQATIAFSAPAFTGGVSITGYVATSNPGGITGTCAGSPCTVTSLANGTTYTFTVSATNSAGQGAASAPSNGVTPKGAQAITFGNPGGQPLGASPTLAATASSGLAVAFISTTPSICTVTGPGVLTTVSVGLCTIDADQPGNNAYAAAPQVSQSFAIGAVTTFTDASPTGNGSITASFAGGGATCSFASAAFVPLSAVPASPPGGLSFPDGLFDFTTTGCTSGSTLAFTITYPAALPAGTVYMKYGATAANPAPHWYALPAVVSGTTVTFSITDGGLGDDDLAANGAVVDQGGPGVPPGSAASVPVPTLSEWMIASLGLLVLLLGSAGLSRRRQSGGR